ncbi:hypothetical protein BFP97_04065 [Roseivirga sp. 4D4]|uniref:DUF4386 domain-containing protein n=1 Tax=Roseivirga sp. 4D4 TaxID=1889784 RepID=UPI00085337A1|nr:DUF4386 domain-containing protein [Roseivirga sp. 4D4]OEK00734.1 hypothetical protein BFP97_04065 [Roseivirga sp. 4D4]
MKHYISNTSPRKAAITVGVAFITSVVLVTIIDDFLLANFVIPGDTSTLEKDIEADRQSFILAVIGYFFVLILDSVIGLALYIVLKPASRKLAWYTAELRLLYAFTLMFGLFALVFQIIDVPDYASLKLFGYIFFALHLLVLGYSVFKSGYIPKSLGILLMFTSFTYIVFFIDSSGLTEILSLAIMLLMLIAELSLSIWLLWKRNGLPQRT